MATYSDHELIQAIDERLRTDASFRRDVATAVTRQKRGWLSSLVINVARMLFGQVIGDIVERAVDWLIDRFR